MTLLIAFLSLLGAGAGLIFFGCRNNDHTAILYVFIGAIGLSLGWIILLLFNSSNQVSDGDRERLAASPYYMVGKFIDDRAANQRIAVLLSRDEFNSPHREHAIEALRSGLGEDAAIEAIPIDAMQADRIALNDDESLPALKFLIQAADYNKKFSDYQDAKVVIIATPLPRDSRNMMLWRLAGKSEIYILNAPARLDLALNSRYISGYTTYNPEAEYDSGIPRSLSGAFNSRYLFVHR